MNGKMRLLLLLLNPLITRWIQYSETANYTLVNCNYENDSDIEMAKLSFEGLNGILCNLSVAASASVDQCFKDIEIDNISCLLNQSENSVSIYPMPIPSSNEDTNLVISTVSTVYVYITKSSDSTSTPATKTLFSNAAQIGMLATSGVVLILSVLLSVLVIVTSRWIRIHRISKEREFEGTGTNFVYSARDSINPPDISLDNNLAYETQTPLQRNLAYEDTTLQSQSVGEPQSSSTQNPTYEIIPSAASRK